MINVHRRWRLAAILGGFVLLLASVGLFVMLRPAVPAATPVAIPTMSATPSPTPSPTPTASQWTEWEDLGGSFTSGPSVTSWGVNRLDVFAQATGQTLLHHAYDGNTWYPPEDLGPAMVGGPGGVAWGRTGWTSSCAAPITSSGRDPGLERGWASTRSAAI
jgi:hypothetical protein